MEFINQNILEAIFLGDVSRNKNERYTLQSDSFEVKGQRRRGRCLEYSGAMTGNCRVLYLLESPFLFAHTKGKVYTTEPDTINDSQLIIVSANKSFSEELYQRMLDLPKGSHPSELYLLSEGLLGNCHGNFSPSDIVPVDSMDDLNIIFGIGGNADKVVRDLVRRSQERGEWEGVEVDEKKLGFMVDRGYFESIGDEYRLTRTGIDLIAGRHFKR